jgi:nucleoside-diphosphate-sugar epimerase
MLVLPESNFEFAVPDRDHQAGMGRKRMRIVVIGGTGHVGTYLVPRLVEAGNEVIVISRLQRKPYLAHRAWDTVEHVVLDRKAAESEGNFAEPVRDLNPDVVVDMICFTLDSVRHLVDGLRDHVKHFLSCGTIWVHGHSVEVPTSEAQVRRPFGEYGIQKAAIERFLLEEAERGFPATVLHPGHIVGKGWPPLNPAGNFNLEVFSTLARGDELALPNLGMETVHHVHADDVAQAFLRAIEESGSVTGESFHVVSPAALTLRGFAERVASWYGQEARLTFLPWKEWAQTVSKVDAGFTWDHIAHSPNCSISKAAKLLNYQPRYSSLEAVRESVFWLTQK